MSVATVDVHELPSRFEELLALAAAGGEVLITDGDVPRARLVAIVPGGLRIPGLHPGAMVMAPDFDDPLPDEFWTGTE
jgi:antitoxin (DNA-binding transcriptional repressor) of toxin-antitoxin stability system